MQIKIFGRDPALWINTLAGLIGVLVTFKLDWLTLNQATAIISFLTIGAGFLSALAVRPFSIQAVTSLVGAGFVLAAAYGLHAPPDTLGAVQLAVMPLLTLLFRGQITPNHDPRPLPGEYIDGELVDPGGAHRL